MPLRYTAISGRWGNRARRTLMAMRRQLWARKGGSEVNRKRYLIAALVVAVGTTFPPTPFPVDGASASAEPSESILVSISDTAPLVADGSGPSAVAACNRYNRTQVCKIRKLTITRIRNGVPIGWTYGQITQAMVFNAKSRKFRESITIKTTRIVNDTPNHIWLSVSCARPCRARNNFPQGRVMRLGAPIRGTIAYADGIGEGKVHSTASRYVLRVTSPSQTVPGPPVSWKSMSYRCDHAFRGRPAGCVIPKFIPIMTSMRRLADIANNIRRIQNSSPGHYGRPGSGHPLHRMMDLRKQRRNRNAVCGRPVTGPSPRPGVTCDEYPFASTQEGGKALSGRNRGWAWVPAAQQHKQRGFITSFHSANRVLGGEPFYVRV